jgi:hypothetical protein
MQELVQNINQITHPKSGSFGYAMTFLLYLSYAKKEKSFLEN